MVVGSLSTLARSAQTSRNERVRVWLHHTEAALAPLVSELLGDEAQISHIGPAGLSGALQSSAGPAVLVCDTQHADVHELLRNRAARSVPIIALCPENHHAVASLLEAGAYDCIVRPFSRAMLASSIRRAATHHQLMNEYHSLEQRVQSTRESNRNTEPDAGHSLPNGRWLDNVLPLDPASKTSELTSLSLGGRESDIDHDVVEQCLSPEQHLRQGHRLGEAKADFERRYLQAALVKCRGNLAAAARCSGMDRSNFRRLLKRYGLHPGSVAR
jgi:DNA-binding NtrC family response regulator